jgi:hypothetical protein
LEGGIGNDRFYFGVGGSYSSKSGRGGEHTARLGDGVDTLIFAEDSGVITVDDFTLADKLDFSHFDFANVSELAPKAYDHYRGGVSLHHDDFGTVILIGVTVDDLDRIDIIL